MSSSNTDIDHGMDLDLDGMISLKEAASRFGYSADYIGQLIRRGKIDGVQVPTNIVWMTTVEAMERYVAASNGRRRPLFSRDYTPRDMIMEFFARHSLRPFRIVMWAGTAVAVIAFLSFFYVASVAIDAKLRANAELRAKERIQVEHALPLTRDVTYSGL